MSTFQPYVDMLLPIGSAFYRFLPHPYFPDDAQEVFAMEGGEGFVYKIQHTGHKTCYALKVLKPGYHDPYVVKVTQCLAQHAAIPGLFLAQRSCLTREQHPELIKRFPDLEYATICPWIEGRTWAGLMLDPHASAQYTLEHARSLATALAYVLWNLEAQSLAHTDISGGNVILGPNFTQVQLIDLEALYLPGVKLPRKRSQGSPGYQHSALDERGQCRPDGDRFAGAMLLTEMLTWWHPAVRARTPDEAESLFAPQELQRQETPRWHSVRNALLHINPALLTLFDQAWGSARLEDCPDFATWSMTLVSSFL
ncbi:MAG TPA: serine/threonine-protein kinase [Ktedonobacteraceae bacterium]|jgi:serine/threonine protein kinase|nr:serine/threonine-protein kinase [Ktedonobacteraceae bacterium]